MKRIKILTLSTLLLSGGIALNAQTLYDANRLMGSDLNGTARFVGMGGAMSALGGDISTMGTNPAGIGIYRSNDAMISFGFNNRVSDSGSESVSKFRGSFDNVGVVLSNKIGNRTSLKYVNFGFNYHKVKNFDKSMAMGGYFEASQSDQMAGLAVDLPTSALGADGALKDGGVPWLSTMAYNTYMIGELNPEGSKKYESWMGITPDGQNVRPSGVYRNKENGGLHAYDFNVAFNWGDCIYLGATLGAYSVDYSRSSYYAESFEGDASNYSLENWFKTEGAGIDFKLGLILRPFQDVPLRIGAAIHTPTFFSLTDYSSARIKSNVDRNFDGTIGKDESYYNDTYEMLGDRDVETPYQLVTPWKYNLSLGYTLGRMVALGAEYEYMDYSSARYNYDDGTKNSEMTASMNEALKGVHTLRLGAEIKLLPEFAVRAGYNYSSASIRSTAYKNLMMFDGDYMNSFVRTRTDTEFSNLKSSSNYTVGMGYRGSTFYCDVAYQLSTYKEDFYAFDSELLKATRINNDRHQVLMTLGMKF